MVLERDLYFFLLKKNTMHAIPTNDGRVIFWYPRSGCAALDCRLYFAAN